jgi:N12 class adenine-specific DNA methylase
MSSVLIQALGKKAIYRDYKNGKYKTASEVLGDFRSLLKQSSSNILFLTNGLSNSEAHINKILDLTNRF